MINLANKYRPIEFRDVCSQTNIIKVLERQCETKQYKNSYLYVGGSGCGKTTVARIFANKINEGVGHPIELDAASNGSVESVRNIIDSANERSLNSKYKIYIIDECHMLTTQAWNALLKTIEETPEYTIFIFCTTEYNKVPETIKNRCQQYFFSKIPDAEIKTRLKYICDQEGYVSTDDGLIHITKLAQGSMRQAISYLDKCKDFSKIISLENVTAVLGDFNCDTYFELTNAIIDKNKEVLIKIIEKEYNSGFDLKLFIDLYLNFVMDILKYLTFRSFDVIQIPRSCEQKLLYTINVEGANKYFLYILDKLVELKTIIKGDSNMKTTIEVMLLCI